MLHTLTSSNNQFNPIGERFVLEMKRVAGELQKIDYTKWIEAAKIKHSRAVCTALMKIPGCPRGIKLAPKEDDHWISNQNYNIQSKNFRFLVKKSICNTDPLVIAANNELSAVQESGRKHCHDIIDTLELIESKNINKFRAYCRARYGKAASEKLSQSDFITACRAFVESTKPKVCPL